MRYLIIGALVSAHIGFSQVRLDTTYYQPPRPTIGWDSVASSFAFSEIARRARIEGAYTLRVQVDSSGEVLSMNIQPLHLTTKLGAGDSVHFINQLTEILRSVSWLPGTWQGRPIRSWVIVPLIFYLRSPGSVPPVIFEGNIRRFRWNGDTRVPIED